MGLHKKNHELVRYFMKKNKKMKVSEKITEKQRFLHQF